MFTPLVVMFLMMAQRLHGAQPLEYAVMTLLRGLPPSFWPDPCERVRRWLEEGKGPSSHTAGYSQARQVLSKSVVEQSCDRMFDQLLTRTDPDGTAGEPGRFFILDGSSVRTAHSDALCELYPPGSNQHGEAHWPVLRMLVAHELRTGLALRPEWGPMYGDNPVSEQDLLHRMIDRLPAGSTIMGDCNFGIFSVVWAAQQRRYPVLLRLTPSRAARLAGGPLRDGIDRAVVWKPSTYESKKHPGLPSDAVVKGRLIVRRVQPGDGSAPLLLSLFTTLDKPAGKLVEVYGGRWNIETDVRTIKKELCLDQLTCTTPEMVSKEIHMAVAAYNLVRAMIVLASLQSGIPPRRYSFTKVRLVLETFGPALANASDDKAAGQIFDQMMRYIQQARLPDRGRKLRPSYPRETWPRGSAFPKRKCKPPGPPEDPLEPNINDTKNSPK